MYGLNVNETTTAQDAAAANWCYSQIGKPYNYNFFDRDTRNSFYCSQLVWAAYKDLYGIDLDTSAWGNAVYPTELVMSSHTSTIYSSIVWLHGAPRLFHGVHLLHPWTEAHMKRRAALLTAFLACAVAALSIAWLTRRNVSPAPTEQASFGVIETRQFQARSRIILYDSELNELGGLPLDYATLGCDWNLSPVYDGTLYVIPQGYTTKRDEKTVLGVDLDDLSVTRYSVDQINLYGVCADDDYIFTCSNLNNVSHICRIDRQTGDVTDIGETDTYIESLCLYDGKLYASQREVPSRPTRQTSPHRGSASMTETSI